MGRCKQKQRGLRGLLCRWPSITEWEMYITASAQGPVPEMTYTVSSGTLNPSIPYYSVIGAIQIRDDDDDDDDDDVRLKLCIGLCQLSQLTQAIYTGNPRNREKNQLKVHKNHHRS